MAGKNNPTRLTALEVDGKWRAVVIWKDGGVSYWDDEIFDTRLECEQHLQGLGV
jgi:hypothetical protein